MRTVETGTDQLTLSVADHVATITLNRPEKRNAMAPDMLDGLAYALSVTADDPDVRVVVLTGAGPAFCAGGDVSTMGAKLSGADAPPQDQLVRGLQARQEGGTLAIFEHPKPTIAALPGAAAGAGMGVALACDLRVGTPKACFVPAFGAIGLSGDWGGTWLMQRLIGPARAKEAYFTGERIYAEDGLSLGLFNRVFDEEGFADAVQSYAAGIATGAPLALQKMKENHNRALTTDLRTFMKSEAQNMVAMMMTEDHQAAAAAFMEKQKPVFKGR
ncbi:MAG: enoyl-CoA hydratase-related protein [Pseudomonadota bacterium]